MIARVLDGKKTKDRVLAHLEKRISALKKKPTLAVISVGSLEPSEIYLREKARACEEIGAHFKRFDLPGQTIQAELESLIHKLNNDPEITGLIVQKPLPKQIDSNKVDTLILPAKDVDGLNPTSPFTPATTRGIFELLHSYKIKVEGKDVVVVGASKLAGLPTALEFLNHNSTVTICTSQTKDLSSKTRAADILVVAAGVPKLITADMVKPGAVVIDIGINRIGGRVVGDVDFEKVSRLTSYITPVPGGVGPMTVAGLMMNLVGLVKVQTAA